MRDASGGVVHFIVTKCGICAIYKHLLGIDGSGCTLLQVGRIGLGDQVLQGILVTKGLRKQNSAVEPYRLFTEQLNRYSLCCKLGCYRCPCHPVSNDYYVHKELLLPSEATLRGGRMSRKD
jgi:hypothetical protein